MLFRRLLNPIVMSTALCLALLVGSSAFALSQTQAPLFVACTAKGENGAEFPAPATMNTGDKTLTLNSPQYVPGFPLMLEIPLPTKDGSFSAGTAEDEKFLVNGELRGDSLSLQVTFHDNLFSLSCFLPSSPPPAPSCDIPQDALEGKVMQCAAFLTASSPACSEWKDFLMIPPDSFAASSSLYHDALRHAQASLPAFYAGGYSGAARDLLNLDDPTLTSVLADIEHSCGRRLNIAPDAALPSFGEGAQWSVFSPQDFTVYLSSALSAPGQPPFHLYQTLLRALALARNSCEARGGKPARFTLSPSTEGRGFLDDAAASSRALSKGETEETEEEFPLSDPCRTDAAAAMSFCMTLVPAFRDVPGATQEFLCSLSNMETDSATGTSSMEPPEVETDMATGTSSRERPEQVCTEEQCGPRPMMANWQCENSDMFAGPTGRCILQDNGECGWEVLSCPS